MGRYSKLVVAGLLLFFCTFEASASFDPPVCYKTGNGAGLPCFESAQAAADSAASAYTAANPPWVASVIDLLDNSNPLPTTYRFCLNKTYNTTTYSVGCFYPDKVAGSCPANSTGPPCVCTPPYVQNAAGTACELPVDCPVGQAVSLNFSVGWFKTLSEASAAIPAVICVQNQSKLCNANVGTPGGDVQVTAYAKSISATGYLDVYAPLAGELVGTTCAGPAAPTLNPSNSPACVGSIGQVNGVTVCIPSESQSSKEARAADAAMQAASLARQAALNAGATTEQASAAATAAGSAASAAVMGGASTSVGVAAGVSAGAASTSSLAGGASAAEASKAAFAGGLGSAASSKAVSAAAAAGVSSAVQTAAADAAKDAATVAATAAITAGKSAAEVASIAEAAGDAAASTVISTAKWAGDAAAVGAGTAAKAAAAGAGAGSAREAFDAAVPGSPDGTGAPGGDMSKFCEDNPTVDACKSTELGSLDAVAVVGDSRAMAITADTGWGEGAGTCPSPRTASVAGMTISMPFDLLCDFANGIRPVVIALAWLSAALAFLGLSKRD